MLFVILMFPQHGDLLSCVHFSPFMYASRGNPPMWIHSLPTVCIAPFLVLCAPGHLIRTSTAHPWCRHQSCRWLCHVRSRALPISFYAWRHVVRMPEGACCVLIFCTFIVRSKSAVIHCHVEMSWIISYEYSWEPPKMKSHDVHRPTSLFSSCIKACGFNSCLEYT